MLPPVCQSDRPVDSSKKLNILLAEIYCSRKCTRKLFPNGYRKGIVLDI